MAIDFKVPDLGENVESGDIVNVLVKEGDEVQVDQSVLEIETGKAVVELPCPYAGRVTKIHVQKGSKVKVGDALLTLEGDNAKAPAAKSKPARRAGCQESSRANLQSRRPAKRAEAAEVPAEEAEETVAAPAKKATATATAKPTPAAAKAKPEKAVATETLPAAKTPPAGPATRRLARELGVDLATVAGSGPHGRITEDDVKATVRNRPASGGRGRPRHRAARGSR